MRSVLTLLGVLLRDAARHPLQAGISVAGIALGLAVVVAVHASGRASRDSFARTFEAVAGRTTHQLRGASGLPPEALLRALAHPGVAAAQPVIEGLAPVVDWSRRAPDATSPPLRLLGIDPLRASPFLSLSGETSGPEPLDAPGILARFLTQPGAILAPEAWAAERGLAAGDVVVVAAGGRRSELTILGLLPRGAFPDATDALAVLDVATADEVLRRGGRLDRIDLIVTDEAQAASVARPGETLERPARRGERAASLTDAFRLNLLALSTLALLVGSYLVFNAAQFAVVRREPLLGQLRCLGASRPALLAAVVLEVGVLGALGGVLGVAAGAGLSRVLVGDVARTVSMLYGTVRVDSTRLSAAEVAAFLALAVSVAVVAGWLPARDAAATAPRLVGSRSARETAFARRVPQLLLAAALGAALALGALLWPTRAKEAGFVAAFGILLLGGALVPPALAVLLPRLRRAAERRGAVTLALAAGDIERSLSRTGIATSALAVALGMAIGVLVMVSSLHREVSEWIGAALVADLYCAPFGQDDAVDDARVPPSAIDVARGLPEVARVDLVRARDAVLEGRLIRVIGVTTPSGESLAGRTFLQGDHASAWASLKGGGAVLSEPLSQHFRLDVGDELVLPARGGVLRAPVAGVVRDYALDRGYAILLDRTYVSAFGDDGVSNMALTLRPGADARDVARTLRERVAAAEGAPLLEITSNAALREQVGVAFDQTFAVTRVLQALATGLALAGIATALASLFLERLREVATLRAMGASLRQVGGLFVLQGGLLAAMASLAALPVGGALAWLLVDVVNLRSFGWSIRMDWPAADVARTCALALGAGLLASLAPWLLARRADIASALREE